MLTLRPSRTALFALALVIFPAACGGEPPPATTAAAGQAGGKGWTPLGDMNLVEDFSEEVAGRLVAFSERLRRRDYSGARAFLAEDFKGQALAPLAVATTVSLPLGAERAVLDVSASARVDRDGFLTSMAELLAPWERVETVSFKVAGAEFGQGASTVGRVHLKIHFQGAMPGGAPRSVRGHATSGVQRLSGVWVLDGLELESLTVLSRGAALFTEVSASAGVAHAGVRFGQPGNMNFAFSGAAAGDVDGDGDFDLFVPSRPRSFLYIAGSENGHRVFADEGAMRGVAEPGGGTGALFIDWDADGDQDLLVADVGWETGDGGVGGNPLRLYSNEGGSGVDGPEGQWAFAERGSALGFDALVHAYSMVAFDRDLDGFLDVFVCDYGRLEVEPNDSWIAASNGSPNLLLANQAGERFEDVTAAAGVSDTHWSYAAAAADLDLDGDQDLYVANDYGPNDYWRNRGKGSFENAAEKHGALDLGNGMGASMGDLDGDGRLDLYVSNMSSTAGRRILGRLSGADGAQTDLEKTAAGNTVLLWRDAGFEVLPAAAGGVDGSWAWAAQLCDVDLDGRLDVFCANGFVSGDSAADT